MCSDQTGRDEAGLADEVLETKVTMNDLIKYTELTRCERLEYYASARKHLVEDGWMPYTNADWRDERRLRDLRLIESHRDYSYARIKINGLEVLARHRLIVEAAEKEAGFIPIRHSRCQETRDERRSLGRIT